MQELVAKEDKRDIIYKKAKEIFHTKNYFSALDTIATQYKYETPDQNVQHFLEVIVLHTGTHYFNTYTDIELRKMNIPTTDLIMAKRNMYLKKYKHALERLIRIPKGNEFSLRSHQLDCFDLKWSKYLHNYLIVDKHIPRGHSS
jgi:hypothetical protein